MSYPESVGRRSPTNVAVAAACLVLVSCSVPLEQAMRSLASAPSCCATAREFAYEPLAPGESKYFMITTDSPSFDFPTGKSYFRAFELPKQAVPYTVAVKGYAGRDVPTGARGFSVFVPALMLLDADHAVTRVIDEKAARREDLTLLPPAKLGMETTVTIGREQAHERFLIVFTPRHVLEGMTEASIPFVIWVPYGAIPTGLRQRVRMHHAPIGQLGIRLSGSERE